MTKVELKFLDEEAQHSEEARALLMPKQKTSEAAGFDLVSAMDGAVPPGERMLVKTGIAIAMPKGFEAQIRPRSGLALKYGVTTLNAPGTIDSDYRGEVGVILQNHGSEPFRIERGMRIAQMIFAKLPEIGLVEVAELDATVRNAGGFGSTGH